MTRSTTTCWPTTDLATCVRTLSAKGHDPTADAGVVEDEGEDEGEGEELD